MKGSIMTKFTQPPWTYEIGYENRNYFDIHGEGDVFALIKRWNAEDRASMNEARANARLSCAAPELFKAAEIASQLCELITLWANAEQEDSYGIMDDIVALAQDQRIPELAIAKALGKKSKKL